MKNCRLLVILIWLVVGLTNCFPRRRKSDIISSFHITGVAFAVDNLIQEYEKEHQKFLQKETNDCGILKWPALDNKSLSNYCRRYLQHSVPIRSADNIIGNKIVRTLNYKKEDTDIAIDVVIVHCKYRTRYRTFSYYITRAPLPKCVYALNCTKDITALIFNIINKYCNFEDEPLRVHRTLKRKKAEIINMKHRATGAPIARDKYLLQYELEHQQMVKKVGNEDNIIEWPYAMYHQRLNFYCSQYMSECAPNRDRDSVKASWHVQKLNYQKIDTNEEIYVTVVTCVLQNSKNRHYHMTRAADPNCVYALLRMDGNPYQPFEIVYKHCDFEDTSDQKNVSQHYEFVDQNILPKTEVKQEISDNLEIQQLFPEV